MNNDKTTTPSNLFSSALNLCQVFEVPESHRLATNVLFQQMCTELKRAVEGKNEAEKVYVLSNHFFNQWRFRNLEVPAQNHSDLRVSEVLKKRTGSFLAILIIYYSFAKEIGLQFNFVKLANLSLLKLKISDKCFYLDIEKNGLFLNHEEIVQKLSADRQKIDMQTLECITETAMFEIYLDQMIELLEKSDLFHALRECLNHALLLDNANLKYLAKRALLAKRLGESAEAIHDLKKYFAYVDFATSPIELRMAYNELKYFTDNDSSGHLLH